MVPKQLRAVLLMCVLPAVLHAQQAPVDPGLVATFGALRQPVRVRIVTRAVHIGDFRAFDADSVRIDQREGIRLIGLRDIRSVSRGTRQVGKGAAIGGITGALLVGAAAYGISRAFCDSSGCNEGHASAAIYGGALGAGAGGLIGAGIGALVPGWRVVYTRP